MIVSNWTMRRFHIASLLVLVCARVVPCMPITSPRPSPSSTPPGGSSEGGGAGEPAATAFTEISTPEVEKGKEKEKEREKGACSACNPAARGGVAATCLMKSTKVQNPRRIPRIRPIMRVYWLYLTV